MGRYFIYQSVLLDIIILPYREEGRKANELRSARAAALFNLPSLLESTQSIWKAS